MAKERIVNVRFWRDNYIVSLRPDARLLFLWAITNPATELCGAYETPLPAIEAETGIKRKRIVEIFDQFEADGRMLYRNGWVIVKNFAKHQHGTSTNIKAAIARTLNDCPDWVKDTVSNGIDTRSHLNLDSVRQPRPRLSERESSPPAASPKKPDQDFPIPRSDANPDLWAKWLAMRRSIKKPLTQVGYDRLVKDLGSLIAFDVNERLELAIDRKWQGLVFKEDKNGTTQQHNNNGIKRTPGQVIAGRWYRQGNTAGQGSGDG